MLSVKSSALLFTADKWYCGTDFWDYEELRHSKFKQFARIVSYNTFSGKKGQTTNE